MNIPFKAILGGATELLDVLTTTKEEERAADLEEKKLEHEANMGQIQTNQIEAKHKSIFVAGWRPAVGWICAIAVGYQFIVYDIFSWIWSIAIASNWMSDTMTPPPHLDTAQLMELLFAMLGMGALRSYDKTKGISTENIPTVSAKENRLTRRLNKIRSKS